MEIWKNRDFTLCIDQSGSMSGAQGGSGSLASKSRWDASKETAYAVANKLNEFDPDGITVYTFNSKPTRYDNQTPDKVNQIFEQNAPGGSTGLHLVLKHAFDSYFVRQSKGTSQPNGESLVIITDGAPDDSKAAAREIVDATKRLKRLVDTGAAKQSDLSVLFVQAGTDSAATSYLKSLDDDLEAQGAAYDIVDAITMDQLGNKNIQDVVIQSITEHKQSV